MALDRPMRMLLIEDSRAGVTTTTRMLSPFGEVRAARSLDEARGILDTGYQPDIIISDLNLGDRREWQETFADVVKLAAGRPILGQTAQVWPELLAEFARLFSDARAELFSKRDERGMVEWLQQFSEDQSGALVRRMGRGTRQSHSDIRGEIRSYLEELGAPAPVDKWLGKLIGCMLRWERRLEAAGELTWRTLLVVMVTGLAGWIGVAFVQWSGAGW